MISEARGGPLDEADDRIVAGRAADGDIEAFAVLVRRYTPMMRACVHRMLGSNAEVDDVLQESFIVAWQRLEELEDPGKAKSWLMRVASRKAVDRLRARRPRADLADVEPETEEHDGPERRAEARAELEALGRALAALPERQRQGWVLRELGGCSYEEIAEEMGEPVSTVRGLLARARKDIIVRMEEWR